MSKLASKIQTRTQETRRHERSVCAACGTVFTDVESFDAHRVGSYEPNTRHCLSQEEMQARSFQRHGAWWTLPATRISIDYKIREGDANSWQ